MALHQTHTTRGEYKKLFDPPYDPSNRYKLQSLPNPAHSLRAGGKTGQNKDLQEEWFGTDQVLSFHNKLVTEIQALLDDTTHNNQDQEESESEEADSVGDEEPLVICVQIGCAKGKHRSVAMVERLAKHHWTLPNGNELEVTVTHRDLQKQGVKENKRTKMDKRSKDRNSKFQKGGDAW